MDHLDMSQGTSHHQLANEAVHDRIVGCLFGSALGDAIGLYTEFLTEDMCARAYPSRRFSLHPASGATRFRRDSHRDRYQPGDWTDDTDHAMLILLSCLHRDCRSMDAQDFASRLVVWAKSGLLALGTLPFGLGTVMSSIVRSESYLEDPEATARSHWREQDYRFAPNTSLVRTHPLGLLCVDKTLDETFETATAYSVVTHVDERCIMSCAIGTALVRGLARREVRTEDDIEAIVAEALSWWEDYREVEIESSCDGSNESDDDGGSVDDVRTQHSQHSERLDEPVLDEAELRRHVDVDDLASLRLDDEHKMGYVYKTLGAGIHVLRLAMRTWTRAGSTPTAACAIFEPLMTDLVMRGGDADANACFAGALLGAYLGYRALPAHWRDGLRHGPWLLHKADGLCQLLRVTDSAAADHGVVDDDNDNSSQGGYLGSEDPDTAPDAGRALLPSQRQVEHKMMLLVQTNAAKRHQWRVQMEARHDEKKKQQQQQQQMRLRNLGGRTLRHTKTLTVLPERPPVVDEVQ